MKRVSALIVFVISAFLVISFVISNEKNKKTPYERYIETSQTTERGEYEPRVIYNGDRTVKYEILSYELIDDKEIAKQTKYPGKYFLDISGEFASEYFLENHLPNPDFLLKDVDYPSMWRDYPLYKEYVESYGERGMTEAEAEEFFEKHEKDIGAHKKHAVPDFGFCYYDGPVFPDVCPGRYTFERGEKPLECVVGYILVDYRGFIDLSEPNTYYYGRLPKSMEEMDMRTINYAGVESLTVINDTPE